jgi:hypothetical protein
MTEQQKTKEEIQKAIIELIVRNQQAIQTVIDAEKAKAAK